MVSETSHGLELDRCLRCEGLWFDGSELEEYIREQRRLRTVTLGRAVRLPNAGFLRCPRCAEQTLEAWSSGSVFLSKCMRCSGIYLGDADVSALAGRRPIYQSPPPRSALERLPEPLGKAVEFALDILVTALF